MCGDTRTVNLLQRNDRIPSALKFLQGNTRTSFWRR